MPPYYFMTADRSDTLPREELINRKQISSFTSMVMGNSHLVWRHCCFVGTLNLLPAQSSIPGLHVHLHGQSEFSADHNRCAVVVGFHRSQMLVHTLRSKTGETPTTLNWPDNKRFVKCLQFKPVVPNHNIHTSVPASGFMLHVIPFTLSPESLSLLTFLQPNRGIDSM